MGSLSQFVSESSLFGTMERLAIGILQYTTTQHVSLETHVRFRKLQTLYNEQRTSQSYLSSRK
jgi:hypothetical protein